MLTSTRFKKIIFVDRFEIKLFLINIPLLLMKLQHPVNNSQLKVEHDIKIVYKFEMIRSGNLIFVENYLNLALPENVIKILKFVEFNNI